MTSEEFGTIAQDWLNSAKHPQFRRLFTRCVYQPQLKLLAYLQFHDFKTYIAVGNSDGDLAMIQYTLAGGEPRLGRRRHHDDGEQEYTYDCGFRLSLLDQALQQVPQMGGWVINMKQDFKQIFPSGKICPSC